MKKIAIIGLGYVGMPLALRLSRNFEVVGFDVSEKRVASLIKGIDINKEYSRQEIRMNNIKYTNNKQHIADSSTYIVTVPTPVDEFQKPDLSAITSATTSIAEVLKQDDFVIFESTVYPGATEEICVEILERVSGLRYNTDFVVGYSPERVSPGIGGKKINEISRIISCSDLTKIDYIRDIYSYVTNEPIHVAPSIIVAEFAKVLENTQRDLNIALINEVSHICYRLGIKTRDVLDAASTKWNFHRYEPGLVGGHCIGVDPYYLLAKSEQLGYSPEVITSGRRTNEKMPHFIVKQVLSKLSILQKPFCEMRVAIFGVTFKEDCSDARNSKSVLLAGLFEQFNVRCDYYDPFVDELKNRNLAIPVVAKFPKNKNYYDAIIVSVPHEIYVNMQVDQLESYLTSESRQNKIIFDVKSIYGVPEYMEL